jgi:hypothetical protein
MLYKKINEEEFASFGGKPDLTIWQIATEQEEADFELIKTKKFKIKELKRNRDEACNKPFDSIQAKEHGTENLVYFSFRVESSGISIFEPSAILKSATDVKYSCAIIEGQSVRKGYVLLDSAIKSTIENHLHERGETYSGFANDQEDAINACTTIDQVNNIDITFV